jgi:hypothetical protein
VGEMSHPVPSSLLAQIGDITVSFALLESIIRTLVGTLVGEDQRIGRVITAELPFRNLRALAISLYKERYGEDAGFATLRELMNRAAVVEEKRNQIVHSVWGPGDTADTVTRMKTTAKETHGMCFQFAEVAGQDLADVATDIKRLAADVDLFWFHLLEEMGVFHDSGHDAG